MDKKLLTGIGLIVILAALIGLATIIGSASPDSGAAAWWVWLGLAGVVGTFVGGCVLGERKKQ